MSEIDYSDLENLMRLEGTLASVTTALNKSIQEESDLEIILIDKLKGHDVKDNLSLKNKMLVLRNICKDRDTEMAVDDWLRASTEIRILKNTLRQVEGRRDSLKKKISIQP